MPRPKVISFPVAQTSASPLINKQLLNLSGTPKSGKLFQMKHYNKQMLEIFLECFLLKTNQHELMKIHPQG